MKRTLSFILLGALLGLSACSNQSAAAASVNGHDISVAQVTTDVAGFGQSSDFRSSLAQQGVKWPKGGAAPTSFAAQWLVSLMQNEAIALVAQRRHVRPTAEEKSQAFAQFKASTTSGKAFGQLPKALQTRIADAAALQSALRSSMKPVSNAPALQAAYQALQADCASKKLVGHILVATPEAAQQVLDELAKGTPFAAVAKQLSTDTGSAAQGGLLTCEGSAQWSQFDATFRAAAEATPIGSVSKPVKTQFGYHVIEALDLTPQNAQPLVAATARPADPLAPELTKYLTSAKLWVNARFGKLRRQGGQFTIDPPTPKTTKSRPSNTPSSTTPSSAPPASAPPDTTPTSAPPAGDTSSTSAPSSSSSQPAPSPGSSSTTTP